MLHFGIQFPSDRYNDPVLIKCVFHGGSDMVPWTHVVGTHARWENVDRSDLRIYTFILVIRLSKVQQLAFFQVSPVVVDVFNRWPL